ncbi:hypothetical protein [Paenibacillus sp. L3-i20]|uniref:hypothetical protein n=1 Tax=Paenibacillus sp. L3-i20 TaxID=2905833 RepID=UPI001EE020B2|nr:hypothetical protein [Paenibacillus sp. L3-i20]GKU78988.1 hypothetical protein L3i20_v233850 [Paenibacillus sp. L3-i20]
MTRNAKRSIQVLLIMVFLLFNFSALSSAEGSTTSPTSTTSNGYIEIELGYIDYKFNLELSGIATFLQGATQGNFSLIMYFKPPNGNYGIDTGYLAGVTSNNGQPQSFNVNVRDQSYIRPYYWNGQYKLGIQVWDSNIELSNLQTTIIPWQP